MMLGLLNVIAEMLLALLRTLKEKIKKVRWVLYCFLLHNYILSAMQTQHLGSQTLRCVRSPLTSSSQIQTIFQYEVFLSANLTTVLFACFMMAVYGHREKSWNFLGRY